MRFIHLADVHLGAVPDRGYAWSARREEEIWDSFRRVIALIRNDPVDLLLIAGDLFHRPPLASQAREVRDLFRMIPDTRVYMMAGNHDYLKAGSPYLTTDWPDNVYVFSTQEPRRVADPQLPVYIYGLSYEAQQITLPLYRDFAPWTDEDEAGEDAGPDEALHILLAHGGDPEHIPLNVRELSAAGFDYIALGHIHRPQILITDRAAYCGALEPIDRDDTGPHGYVLGWTQNGRLRTRFVTFASRSYHHLETELSTEDTRTTIEERIRQEILSQGPGDIYVIRLTGERAPDLVIFPEKLKRLGNVLEVLDESRPRYDLEELYHRYRGTIIGDYIHSFFGREGDSLPEAEEKALFYGLQALLETVEPSGSFL